MRLTEAWNSTTTKMRFQLLLGFPRMIIDFLDEGSPKEIAIPKDRNWEFTLSGAHHIMLMRMGGVGQLCESDSVARWLYGC